MMTRIGKFLRMIFIFYRGFWIPAALVTLFCCIFSFSLCVEQVKEHKEFYGILMFITPSFWIKILTNILILLYLISFKANEMYFYYNFGIGKTTLWITTFIIDFLLFFLAIWLTGLSFDLFYLPLR